MCLARAHQGQSGSKGRKPNRAQGLELSLPDELDDQNFGTKSARSIYRRVKLVVEQCMQVHEKRHQEPGGIDVCRSPDAHR